MFRHTCIGISIALICLMPYPAAAAPQSFDEAYRSYLLEIIDLLRTQIALLSTRTDTDTLPAFSSLLLEEDDVTARYAILNTSLETISKSSHRALANRFFRLVPNAYDDYIAEIVFYDGAHSFDAFVETVASYDADIWRLGVHTDMLEFELNEIGMSELLVHEFAHIVSYENDIESIELENTVCHPYFEASGCPLEYSYINGFTQAFWNEKDLDRLAAGKSITTGYTDHSLENSFVSEYATSAPEEDFAESFASFVMYDQPTGTRKRDKKIQYFYQFPHLVSLRSEIRSAL